MLHNSPKKLLFALLTLLLSGCLNEDTQLQPELSGKGRIVLNLSDIEVYTDAEVTRSVQTLDDLTGYVFTLNDGTTDYVVPFELSTDANNQTIAVGYFEAGTYTSLTVSNKAAAGNGYSAPYWEGCYSSPISFSVGGTVNVSIDMGKPQNAMVVVDSTNNAVFAEKYEHVRLTLTDGTHSTTIAKAGTTGCSTEAYFPALDTGTTLNYTLTARAKSGSHVTDITSARGSITVVRGNQHTITLNADPVTGILIPVVSGTHTGEFD